MAFNRRNFLLGGTAVVALGAAWFSQRPGMSSRAAEGRFEISMTDDEWKNKLGAEAYEVLRREGTERPFTSPLNEEHRAGIYSCAGCDLPNFDASAKFDSGTGWPSFYQPLPNAVGETTDTTLGMVRTEVHCSRCGGHLGHVFNDGPQPTGLRYCMNGVALKFTPNAA
jgi:peptide-methionine (R)-S-oxide reductase